MPGSLSDPRVLGELLQRHGLRLRKSLGQNFLINPSVCPRMAAACGAESCAGVLEIGPGVGVLTRELSKAAKRVVAIELDRRLLEVLGETLEDCPNVEIIEGDALTIDLGRLIEEKLQGGPVCVCANLPYYITSPVIMALLEGDLPLTAVTVMVQREAARRLCAPPGVRECGAVSVSIHYRSEPKVLFNVSRGSFMPPPKVDSAVIRFDMLKEPRVAVRSERALFRVARAAFAQRRKTAVNSVSAALGLPKDLVQDRMAKVGLPPAARAEELTIEAMGALSDLLCDDIFGGDGNERA